MVKRLMDSQRHHMPNQVAHFGINFFRCHGLRDEHTRDTYAHQAGFSFFAEPEFVGKRVVEVVADLPRACVQIGDALARLRFHRRDFRYGDVVFGEEHLCACADKGQEFLERCLVYLNRFRQHGYVSASWLLLL